MSTFKLLIVSPTTAEMAPLLDFLRDSGFHNDEGDLFALGNFEIYVLHCGIGLTAMSVRLTPLLYALQPDLCICMGIAGSFDRSVPLGEVFNVESEQFGDLGVEEVDGSFGDLFDMDWVDPDDFPFQGGRLINPGMRDAAFLPRARSLSVNKVHGFGPSIEAIRSKYDVKIENMEGAAFFYACLMANVPFLEIRSVSNYVEPRNRNAWRVDLAIDRLNEAIIDMVRVFSRK